ncbi:MAG: ATP-binding protein, partial [Deltaproteobacteria bacterium]
MKSVEFADVLADFQALYKKEECCQVLFETFQDGLLLVIDGKILHCNEMASLLVGHRRAKLIGRRLLGILVPAREANRHAKKIILQYLAEAGQGMARTFEWSLKKGHGKIVDTEISISRILLAGHALLQVVIRDVSRRKQMERELVRIQKLEAAAGLAGGIGHDFNNLLSGILGNISLAKTLIVGQEEALRKLEAAEKASLRARVLTRQLQAFAKGGQPVLQPGSVSNLIRETAKFALSGSSVTLEYEEDPDLNEAEIDQGQFSQVIQNLAINAVEAMPDGGRLRIRVENVMLGEMEKPMLPAGGYLLVTVSDSGTGIAPELLDKIFDPYFTTKKQGSGLGLSVSYSIIARHGGQLSVESVPGEGTTFRIYLPARLRVTMTSADKKKPELIFGSGRILVMDDNPLVREIIVSMLGYLGYDFEVATNGEEAVRQYAEAAASDRKFEAVILNLTIQGGMG